MYFQITLYLLACRANTFWDFPGGSANKESACSMGNLGSIPELGRSHGEGNGYPPVFWPEEFHGLYVTMGSQRVGHN